MIETNIQNLSVEEIMQKIKDEVEKRKNSHAQAEEDDSVSIDVDFEFKYEYKNIINKKDKNFKSKDIYEYCDFTKYHDVEFIQNIYKGILKREADTQGLNHYLELLRSGKKSKSEIISTLRYSKEGQNKKVNLLGSKKRYIYTVLSSVPLFGYVFKLLVTLAMLPKMQQRLNMYENYVSQEVKFSDINDTLLEKELNNINNEVDRLKSILQIIEKKL